MFRIFTFLLIFTLSLTAKDAGVTYWEDNGIIAIEIETAPCVKSWKKETSMKGFSGECYYTWKGANSFGSAGKGLMEWKIVITKPGKYTLNIRNRHDYKDSTEENDCFTQMNNGQWVKTFSSKRGEWCWNSIHEWSHSKKIPAVYDLSAGVHTFRISGRSHGFSIDRFHLFHESVNKKVALNTSLNSESRASTPAALKDKRLLSYWNAGKYGMVARECQMRLKKGENPEAQAALDAISSYMESRKSQISRIKDHSPSFYYAQFKELVSSMSYTPHEKELKTELLTLNRDKEFQKALQAEKMYKDAVKKFETKSLRGQPRPVSKRTLQSIAYTAKKLKQYYPDSPYYDDLVKRLQDNNYEMK